MVKVWQTWFEKKIDLLHLSWALNAFHYRGDLNYQGGSFWFISNPNFEVSYSLHSFLLSFTVPPFLSQLPFSWVFTHPFQHSITIYQQPRASGNSYLKSHQFEERFQLSSASTNASGPFHHLCSISFVLRFNHDISTGSAWWSPDQALSSQSPSTIMVVLRVHAKQPSNPTRRDNLPVSHNSWSLFNQHHLSAPHWYQSYLRIIAS